MLDGLIGVLVGLGFIAIGVGFLHLALRQIQIFERCPKRRIWQLKLGMYAYITGQVQGKAQLHSPIGQTLCNFWSVTVTETVKHGKTRSIRILYSHRSTEAIILTDGTGELLVLPSQVRMRRKPAFRDTQSIFSPFKDPRVLSALQRFGVQSQNLLQIRRSLTVTEHVLQAGTPVFIWGRMERLPQTPGLSISPLLLSDLPRSAWLVRVAGKVLLSIFLFLLGSKVVMEMWLYMVNR